MFKTIHDHRGHNFISLIFIVGCLYLGFKD